MRVGIPELTLDADEADGCKKNDRHTKYSVRIR